MKPLTAVTGLVLCAVVGLGCGGGGQRAGNDASTSPDGPADAGSVMDSSADAPAGDGTPIADANAGDGVPGAGATTADRLGAALAAGKLTYDDVLVYEILATFNDPRLPAEYRAARTGTERHDLVMMLAGQRFSQMTATQQDLIGQYFVPPAYETSPPTAPFSGLPADEGADDLRAAARDRPGGCTGNMRPGWIAVPSDHFKVWYDSMKRPELASFIHLVLAHAEESYTELVTKRHLRSPLDDTVASPCDGADSKLDIYLDGRLDPPNMDTGNDTLGRTTPSGEGSTYPVFFSLRPMTIAAGASSTSLSEQSKATIAHELMHGIQHAYEHLGESSYFWTLDGMAQWAEAAVYPGNSDAQATAADFMQRMDSPLFFPTDYCNLTNACMNDSNATFKLYGNYLFFEFATERATPGVDFVSAFLEHTAQGLDSNPLDSLNFTLIAAGEGGLTKAWADFVLAVWNASPVEPAKSFRGWENLTDTWQEATTAGSPDSDLQAIDIPANAASVVEYLPNRPDPMDATKRESTNVNELSGVYQRFSFGTSVRSIFFFNGFSQNLTKSPLTPTANVGPGGATMMLDGGSSFAVLDTTVEERKGRHIWALKKTASTASPSTGTWTLEDWTDLPFVTLCRDKVDERVLELVLIFSNGNYTTVRKEAFETNAIGPLGDREATMVASKIPCWKYQGWYDSFLPHNDMNDNIVMSSSLFATFTGQPFVQQLTNPNRRSLRGLRFTADADTISFARTLKQSCGPVEPAVFETVVSGAEYFSSGLPSFDNVIAVPGSVGENAYWQGTGEAMVYQWPNRLGCDRTIKPTPAVRAFDLLLKLEEWQRIDFENTRNASGPSGVNGRVSRENGYPNPGEVTNHWCLAAMRQRDDGSVDAPAVCLHP